MRTALQLGRPARHRLGAAILATGRIWIGMETGSDVNEIAGHHTFLAVLSDRMVYIDVPHHEAGRPFLGWQVICRSAAIERGLMTEKEAKDAVFHPAVRLDPPATHWR